MNVLKSNAELKYERIAGKLDAAMVFAAAALEGYEVGNKGYGDVCHADAREDYASIIDLISSAPLTSHQRTRIEKNLNVLRSLLDRIQSIDVKAA